MDTFVTGTLPQKRKVEVDVNKAKSGRRKIRKYDSLNFGFAVAEKEGVEHSQCVICCKVLAAQSMLTSKLKRHLTTQLIWKTTQIFCS